MIDTGTVVVVLLIELSALTLGIALLLGHGAHTAWRAQRVAPRQAAVRRSLLEALEKGSPALVVDALRAHLPVKDKVALLAQLAPTVVGSRRVLLTEAAATVGLLKRASTLCASRSWRRRLRGARLFTLLGGGSDTMPRLFDDPRPEVRAQAAEWAGGHPDNEDVVRRLVHLLGDPDTLCRFTVEDALLRVGQSAVPQLSQHLASAREDSARRGLRVAASMADARLLAPTLERSGDSDVGVRAAAARVLGALGGAAALEKLEALLIDDHPEVRAAAADSIGRLRHWPAASGLGLLLSDDAWDVRRSAALALRELGAVGALHLRSFLSDADPFARDMASHVLGLPAGGG